MFDGAVFVLAQPKKAKLEGEGGGGGQQNLYANPDSLVTPKHLSLA